MFKSHRSDVADGGQRRDFMLLDDMADVALWAMSDGPACGLPNVGAGRAMSFHDPIAALFDAVGRQPRISYFPMPEELRDRYQYATRGPLRTLQNAGYRRPFTPIPETVARYCGLLGAADRYR